MSENVVVDTDRIRRWQRDQLDLRQSLLASDSPRLSPLPPGLLIAGLDITYPVRPFPNAPKSAVACIVLVHYPSLRVLDTHLEEVEVVEPYVSGYLAFREAPPLVRTFERWKEQRARDGLDGPDVVMVDGNGTLHPRGFGSACYIGLLLSLPTIGISKKWTVFPGSDALTADGVRAQLVRDKAQACEGKEKEKEKEKEDGVVWLSDARGEVHGAAVLPPSSSHPIYVSPGHLISHATSVHLVLACCQYRIPEPVRQADLRGRDYVRTRHGVDGAS